MLHFSLQNLGLVRKLLAKTFKPEDTPVGQDCIPIKQHMPKSSTVCTCLSAWAIYLIFLALCLIYLLFFPLDNLQSWAGVRSRSPESLGTRG